MPTLMTSKHATLLLALGSLCLGSCATDPNAIVVKPGYHRRLPGVSANDASKFSAYLLSTPFAPPPTAAGVSPTCAALVQAFNAQLTQAKQPLQLKLEFSKGPPEEWEAALARPLTTWQGTPLEATEIQDKLSTATMEQVLAALGAQLGLQAVWYSGTVILCDDPFAT